MSTFGERLREARKDKGLSQGNLAKIVGVKQPTIAELEAEGKGSSKASLIAKALNVSPLWLSEGRGDKHDNNIIADIESSAAQAMGEIASPSNIIKIPLLNITASVGYGSENTEEVPIAYISINADWAKVALRPLSDTSNLAFIHAVGDSMFPTFTDGDILLVDTWNKSVTADKIYVIEAHDRLFIKRVRQRLDGAFEVSSDNPAVKTVDVLNGDSEVRVKGHVIWVWNGKKI
jgi:phage repressor protein C with HTH and peptisase S24 domain